MRSVVRPGTGSAQSKYSGFVSTQKYIVLKSSGKPDPGALRGRPAHHPLGDLDVDGLVGVADELHSRDPDHGVVSPFSGTRA